MLLRGLELSEEDKVEKEPIIGLRYRPEGKLIISVRRFTELSALSVNPSVGISRSASETNNWLFFLPIIGKNRFLFFLHFTYNNISIISFDLFTINVA